MFQNAVDIGNRALQQCGVSRISDFTEDSLQAAEVAFVYDKLRRAELRRNVWQFAIRNCAIRAIGVGTMVLAPAMWSSTTTYTLGSIVSDSSNVLWASRLQSNLNQSPGNTSAWELYCGPMTAAPYDTSGTTGYFSGELVYETPGDGTAITYLSLQNNNGQDPRAPSQWSALAQYALDGVVAYYAPWAIGTTYAAGNTITYLLNVYVSLAAGNLGNNPATATAQWALTSATLAPAFYNSATAYAVGTFVTYLGVNYVSILAGTGQTPSSSPTYWVAQAAPTYYASLIDFNLNNNPASSPAPWAAATTYATGNSVGASNGNIYTSVGNGNTGNDPTLTSGLWTNTGVLTPWLSTSEFGTANDLWLQIVVALTDVSIIYPIGTGPNYQTSTKNCFRLPANFLRKAPTDPKAGSISFLGAPTGLMYDDWELQGAYLVSGEVGPIAIRFVADVSDVRSMDDMFCEGLAARIALEVVEILTQSAAKKGVIAADYKLFMTEARLVNGIETGAVEPPEDDYLTVRI